VTPQCSTGAGINVLLIRGSAGRQLRDVNVRSGIEKSWRPIPVRDDFTRAHFSKHEPRKYAHIAQPATLVPRISNSELSREVVAAERVVVSIEEWLKVSPFLKRASSGAGARSR